MEVTPIISTFWYLILSDFVISNLLIAILIKYIDSVPIITSVTRQKTTDTDTRPIRTELIQLSVHCYLQHD